MTRMHELQWDAVNEVWVCVNCKRTSKYPRMEHALMNLMEHDCIEEDSDRNARSDWGFGQAHLLACPPRPDASHGAGR